MGLDWGDCLSLTYPEPITAEDVLRLVRAISDTDSDKYAACEALVSHGSRVSREVSELLGANDSRIVTLTLEELRMAPRQWDESVVKQVERHLKSEDEYVQALAIVVYGRIAPNRDECAAYLCDLAAGTKSMCYVCMGALTEMDPPPSSCRPKLERLIVQYSGDSDLLESIQIRLSEIEDDPTAPS